MRQILVKVEKKNSPLSEAALTIKKYYAIVLLEIGESEQAAQLLEEIAIQSEMVPEIGIEFKVEIRDVLANVLAKT